MPGPRSSSVAPAVLPPVFFGRVPGMFDKLGEKYAALGRQAG
jgi:hypothetical protein